MLLPGGQHSMDQFCKKIVSMLEIYFVCFNMTQPIGLPNTFIN